ncbi:MAG: cob(I)yrinic acid a,c-diamide adenosyltransferase [Clostridiaceae bacterium]|nr:cob(I)yrinic acid a,c-diamide adenosyltransferase [Clostridiaceae bacterium]
MIHIYTGDGKGKTTAAIGLAIRNMGCDGMIFFAQFLKSSETGEMNVLSKLDRVTFFRPFMRHKGFIFDLNEKQYREIKEDIEKGFGEIKNTISNNRFTLIVFDEILDVIELGFLSEAEVIAVFDQFPSSEFVITGRKATQAMKERADYITVMKKEKHPFDKGIKARKGIEY